MAKMNVEDLMTPRVISVGPTDTVSKVVQLMEAQQVRHMPVVDDDGILLGLISNRDVLRSAILGGALPLSNQEQLLRSISAEEIMVREVETASADQDLREAAQLMLENKFGCLPVTEDGRLVGILTEADFVRRVVELLDPQS